MYLQPVSTNIDDIYNQLQTLVGSDVILLQMESHKPMSYLVHIQDRCGTIGVTACYSHYNHNGEVAGRIPVTISSVMILTGEQRIITLEG